MVIKATSDALVIPSSPDKSLDLDSIMNFPDSQDDDCASSMGINPSIQLTNSITEKTKQSNASPFLLCVMND